VRTAYDLADEGTLIALLAAAMAGDVGWPAACARVGALLGFGSPAPVDARVAAAVRRVRAAPARCPDLATLAAGVGLSASRLRHLLAAATGVPFRRYRLWCRLRAVVRAAAAGAPLTRAAHDAGFASSAHLSAAFRAMFGLSLTRLHVGRLTLVDLTEGP
jgi:AraC-like DNA-binding protein